MFPDDDVLIALFEFVCVASAGELSLSLSRGEKEVKRNNEMTQVTGRQVMLPCPPLCAV